MKTAVLLVLTPADVTALPTAAAELKAAGTERLWVIHSPSLGVTSDSVARDFDAKIAALEANKKAAAARDDFEGAKQFKEEIEAQQIEKSKALKDGWKSVAQEERFKVYDKVLLPLRGAANAIQLTTLAEDYTPDNVFGMMQGLLAQWPAEIPHGEYSLVFPRNCVTPVSQAMNAVQAWKESKPSGAVDVGVGESKTVVKKEIPAPKPQLDTTTPEGRRKQLNAQYMKMKQVAKQYGISMEGKTKEAVLDEILAKEFATAA